ncbi:MAG TPA: ABC transporter ATP-binding protein [Chloroflexia bacterium]
MSRTIKQPERGSASKPQANGAKGGSPNGKSLLPGGSLGAARTVPGSGADKPYKVIKFSKVSKRFILHHERPRSFQDVMVSLFGLRSLSKRGVAMPRPANEEFWALRDVNFSIYAGEAVGIIGENGSGKSTTLKLISRILEPSTGSVSVRGKVSALLELGTGFHPELTGRENVFLNGSLLGLSRKEMASRYDAIVDFSEIGEFIDTPIKHYSSGMVMRLGFAVAINVDPDILLTDEVLAVGDEAFQRKCLDYIAKLRSRGVTIVFVSHALEAVRSLCSRAIWLDHGRMIADGPAGQVVDQYLTYENEKHAERLKAGHESRPPSVTTANRPQPMTAPLPEEDEDDMPPAGHGGQLRASRTVPLESPDVKITGVTFLDAAGESSHIFYTNQPLTVRLHFNAKTRVEDPVFGLALYTENGTHINGPNTRFSGLVIPAIEGTGYADYHIERLPLMAGRYFVTVAVTGREFTNILDHQHRASSFVVQPTPQVAERAGLVLIPAEWSFHLDQSEA